MTDSAPHVDLDQARRYLAALCGDESARCAWQTFDDNKARKDKALAYRLPCCPFATVQRELVERNGRGAGVFVTVNDTGDSARVVDAPIVALRALFVDCDGGQPLPESWPLQPSIIVQRDATHWHAYWCLVEGESVERFTPAQVALAGHWISDLAVSDRWRVLRIPGFLHCKAEARPVTLLHADGSLRYTIDQVLDAHPVADWDDLPAEYRAKAERVGILEPRQPAEAAAPAPTSRPMGEGQEGRYRWMLEVTAKWAESMDAGAGAANPRHGSRDNAGFILACKCQARGLTAADAADLVRRYWTRSGYLAKAGRGEEDVARVVKSAYSKQREDRRMPVHPDDRPRRGEVRAARPQSPQDGEDLFAAADGGAVAVADDAGAGDPPGDDGGSGGGGDDADDAGGEPAAFDGLDVAILRDRWAIGENGVIPMEWDGRAGATVGKVNKRLGNLPIWPCRVGRDVATGRSYMHIAWVTPDGETRRTWLPEEDVKAGDCLLKLAEGPIAGARFSAAAVWLTEARRAITNPMVEVTSRLGWCGVNGSRRWVWPTGGDAGVRYIGSDLPSHGDLEGWKKGLNHVLGLGKPGYVALVAAALSAAAPWARLLSGQRNPTLGLQARSSSGKGSVLDWVLAIWCDASALTLPATSTAKGIQDRGIDVPDLPIFLDELQQLAESDPRGLALSNAMYYLGNGQQRVRATKAGGAEGGARRYGVGFYAAEAPVLAGRNEGVALRAVELTGDPCPDEATARILRAAGAHTGVLAVQISEAVRSRSVSDWATHLRERSGELAKAYAGLRAGDSDVLALVERGCGVLADCCDLDNYPTPEVLGWLAEQIAAQRKAQRDREAVCLREVLDLLLNLGWDMAERRTLNQRPIAWRCEVDDQRGGTVRRCESYDCDPSHPALAQIFERAGGEDRVLAAWRDRGWIVTQPPRLRVRRRGADGGYVVRFAAAGLVQAGYDVVPAGQRSPAPAAAAAASGDDGEPPF